MLPAKNAEIEVAEFESEYVVFDPRNSDVYLLESTTAVVFDACDGVTPIEELVAEFVAASASTEDDARAIVDDGLIKLRELGLLEGGEAPVLPPCLGCKPPEPVPLRKRRGTRGSGRLRGRYSALGVEFVVHAPDELGLVIEGALADLQVDHVTDPIELRVRRRRNGNFDVEWGDDLHAGDIDEKNALAQVFMTINAAAATAAADAHAVFHASVFEVDGVGVAIAGQSGAGKSTLAAGAVLRGFRYVCDEVCAVDADGTVLPYQRPVGLRRAGAAALGVEVPSHDRYEFIYPLRLGSVGSLGGPVPLGMVILATYREGLPEFERLSPAMALFRLSSCSVGSDDREVAMFRRFESLARSVPVWSLGHDDTDVALSFVLEARESLSGLGSS